MKKLLLLSLAAAFLAGNPLSAAPSGEELIKKHLKAIGGEEAHRKLKTRQMKGVIQIPAMGLAADMVLTLKAPDKQRVDIDIPGMGKVSEGYDGKIAWASNAMLGGVIEKSGAALKEAKKQADFYRDIDLMTRYESWTLKGKETVDGKSTHMIEGKSKEGTTDVLYLDEQTHLIVQLKVETETDEGRVVVTSRLGDYKEVDGIQVPHSISVEAEAGGFNMKVTEVKHGLELDDKLFAKPAAP
jgi:hypothetical protein